MKEFVLKKGSVVHFGTISNHLENFFRDGIPESLSREGNPTPAGMPSEPQIVCRRINGVFLSVCGFRWAHRVKSMEQIKAF